MPEQSWIITTAVGTGEKGYAGDGGPAARALLNGPFDVGFDARGNLYFSDTFNHCIRRVDARTGVITTCAGCGEAGYSGDGGPARAPASTSPTASRSTTPETSMSPTGIIIVFAGSTATRASSRPLPATALPGLAATTDQPRARAWSSRTAWRSTRHRPGCSSPMSRTTASGSSISPRGSYGPLPAPASPNTAATAVRRQPPAFTAPAPSKSRPTGPSTSSSGRAAPCARSTRTAASSPR